MQMTLIRGELGPGSTDLEEFEGLVPNFASLMPSLYRCGSCWWCWCWWWCWRWPPSWWLKRSSYHLSAGAPPAYLQRLLTKLTLRSAQGSLYNHHDLCISISSSSDSPASLRDNQLFLATTISQVNQMDKFFFLKGVKLNCAVMTIFFLKFIVKLQILPNSFTNFVVNFFFSVQFPLIRKERIC